MTRFIGNTTRRAGLIFRSIDIPTFLCPALLTPTPYSPRLRPLQQQRSSLPKAQRRCLQLPVAKPPDLPVSIPEFPRRLPTQCTGCGAYTQLHNKDELGYFSLKRRSVVAYIHGKDANENSRKKQEEEVVLKALQNANSQLAASIDLDLSSSFSTLPTSRKENNDPPVCDRCHRLTNHHTGVSIHHPSITSIQDTLDESPYKYNHIYHVLDAADFPMSLIPRIHELLEITPQRSRNRRSRSGKFYHNRKTEMSFIITRSDLLAPQKDQVDSLMPYLVEVLRDALGRNAKDIRLGNVRCVSAKRDWWTAKLKEEIWNRGGGGWMVGKVNVGKSQLFSNVFPKGRMNAPEFMKTSEVSQPDPNPLAPVEAIEELEPFDPDSLLPPVMPEVNYPPMPLVSALPGTTASPIRVPYGNGRGELIDLPGLARGDLELHVQPEHRPDLVMRSRVCPEQHVIKPGKSLLLGGLIRITPTTPDLIFLAYAFTPIPEHMTSTEKAIAIQEQREDAPKAHIIALPETAAKISSAGKFKLKWDVTKARTGPVTRREAGGVKVDALPFKVLSTDILIEGCGWVELVAQVRKKDLERQTSAESARDSIGEENEVFEPNYPEVEVFSPEGRFVAARRPMNGWLLGGPKKAPANARKTRPRPSKTGEKKRLKAAKRDLS